MTARRSAALLVAFAFTAAHAPAIDLGFGLFKRRKPNDQQPQAKPDPALKLKQTLATLQSDPDVDRRLAAAADLRAHDPRSHGEIVPTLVGSIQKDPSPDVRARAAETLGGYRSVSATAAAALETAEQTDPDKSVRAAAKSALWQYGLNGYKPSAPAATASTGEPPLAKPTSLPKSAAPAVVKSSRPTVNEPPFRAITQGPAGTGTPFHQTAEPPLARSAERKPVPTTAPATPTVTVPQRMPATVEPPSSPSTPVRTVPANTVLPPAAPSSTVPLPLPVIPTVTAPGK
jgi:hypothetical protein